MFIEGDGEVTDDGESLFYRSRSVRSGLNRAPRCTTSLSHSIYRNVIQFNLKQLPVSLFVNVSQFLKLLQTDVFCVEWDIKHLG